MLYNLITYNGLIVYNSLNTYGYWTNPMSSDNVLRTQECTTTIKDIYWSNDLLMLLLSDECLYVKRLAKDSKIYTIKLPLDLI